MANAMRQARVRRKNWAEVQYTLSIEETFAKGIIYESKHNTRKSETPFADFMMRACRVG